MTLACLCGRVRLGFETRPAYIHACNCKLCRKTGAWWSYHHPSEVSVEGATSGFVRADKADAGADVRFCSACGSTTHFVLTADATARFGNTLMGVNMGLADEADLAGIELRYPDGRAWSGEGEFIYVRPPRTLGVDGAVH